MDSVASVYNNNVDKRNTLVNPDHGEHSDPMRILTNNHTHKEGNHHIKNIELGNGTIPIDDGDVDANDGDGDGDGDDSDKRKDNSKNVSISGNRSPKPSVSRNLRSAPANRHVIPCSLDPNHDHRHSSPPPMVIHHNFLKKS